MVYCIQRWICAWAGTRWCRWAQPPCRARCVDDRMHGRGVVAEDGAAEAAEASERYRTRILTPDSSSRGRIYAFGRKYGPLARICSGSLDRLVLGHLCTDGPQNTCNRLARAHGCSIGHGSWAAGHGEWVWGTAGKQQRVSHAHLGRAPASQKALLHAADKAAWRPLTASIAAAEKTASRALDMCCAVRIWAALPCIH
jgi:hypothetical protein